MMDIDEAIQHAEEKAKELHDEYGVQHKQLAEWLRELKSLRESVKHRDDLILDFVMTFGNVDPSGFVEYSMRVVECNNGEAEVQVQWQAMNTTKSDHAKLADGNRPGAIGGLRCPAAIPCGRAVRALCDQVSPGRRPHVQGMGADDCQEVTEGVCCAET